MYKLIPFSSDFFRDENGKIIIAQSPNVPLFIWGAGLLIAKISSDSDVQSIASLLSFAGLAVWALLEIFTGVNYFRRTLGFMILILSIYSRAS